MNTFNHIISTLERVATEDLDQLAVVTTSEDGHEAIDRIQINISSHLAEARTSIIDSVRLRQVRITSENLMNTINGQVLVLIHGVVRNQRTTRSTGHYAVVWNCKHKLNVCKENILSNKTPHSSHLLGLLAFVNQLKELKIKHAYIISTSSLVKYYIQQLPLWHSQNFLTGDNRAMTNHALMSMTHNIIHNEGMKLTVFDTPVQESIQGLSSDLIERAKELITERMRAAQFSS